MILELIRMSRSSSKSQTLGILVVKEGNEVIFACRTLELGENGNKKNISCIPEGNYEITKRNSSRYGECIQIHGVQGREGILIHAGNYNTETKGCILVGKGFEDLNGDGELDITNSKETLKKLIKAVQWGTQSTIKISKTK